MAEQPTEKTCTKCGETKPLEEFGNRARSKDGKNPQCKQCRRQYYWANPKPYKDRSRRRYAANVDSIKEQQAEWREANRERLREAYREYRAANLQRIREEERERSRERREADPEAWREKWRSYAERNREEIRSRARERYWADLDRSRRRGREWYWGGVEENRRRSREWHQRNPHAGWAGSYRARVVSLGIDPVIEDFTKADVIAKYGDACFYCETGSFEHLDHYVPVSKGGAHTLDNVRPACAGCNSAKNDADPEEWLAEQAEFDALTEEEQNALIDAEIARWIDSDDTE